MTQFPLAAICIDEGNIDPLLHDIAKTVSDFGLCVRGALQTRGPEVGECHCADMDLTTLGSGRIFRISQPLGNAARGCRLHPGALAECSRFLEQELEVGADLLILNRFGKGESEGRGFRDLIGKAVLLNVPILTAVRPTYRSAWNNFGDGLACDLAADREAILSWFATHREARCAA